MTTFRLLALAGFLCAGACAGAADPITVQAEPYRATMTDGALTSLTDSNTNTVMIGSQADRTVAIRHLAGDCWAEGPAEASSARSLRHTRFPGLDEASMDCTWNIESDSQDLVFRQTAQSAKTGLWGVTWAIGPIPLEFNIIVPAHSGLRFSQDSPGSAHEFDYPVRWEAQLVIVEGEGRGFYVWAEDEVGRFKRLRIERKQDGWYLHLTTINHAPFDALQRCESVPWHVNVYQGDWRVPARRYRDWMTEHFNPTLVQEQQPAWVKDMRCCVIMGLDLPTMEALAQRLDPTQTMLYIPSWRAAGYDRDYPTYDEPVDALEPFVARAKELGYRVMLHVNYFGCDPLHPLYEQFEPYQLRRPWGDHEKEWWLWTRATPEIKFAYINPAHKPWRDLFVGRMVQLCESFDIDALHLDQTLVILNDHNGLMDGMSAIQGNIALHRQLRDALPNVALSGEGLDEVTYRYEAFAQRHVWGIAHHDGTWNRARLECAHPISSYLLRPYTVVYGYLGCAPPTEPQLYSAWKDAYQPWGVIPTLKPGSWARSSPADESDSRFPFVRQFFDELGVWQEARLEPAMDGPWPSHVRFPYATADGRSAAWTVDGRLVCDGGTVSRTVTGVTSVNLPGTVPGWHVYDEQRLLGLEPNAWYPYFDDPRDPLQFHIAALPEGFRATSVVAQGDLAAIRTEQVDNVLVNIAARFQEALCRSEPYAGDPYESTGGLTAPDGGMFTAEGDVVHAHPPWKVNGTGEVCALLNLDVPPDRGLRFVSDVAMDAGAVRENGTDGVTYRVIARTDETEAQAEIHNATDRPQELALDLTPFAGQRITLELRITPGPSRNPSFDWARWYRPRITRDRSGIGEIRVAGDTNWAMALSRFEALPTSPAHGKTHVRAQFPGAVYLLKDVPETVALPLELASAPFWTTFLDDTGQQLAAPVHACARRAESTIAGVKRAGLFTHPPNRGRTVADFALTLPQEPAAFHSFIGLRDKSESEGATFIVEVNGLEQARVAMLPGEWHEISTDLTPWRGKPAVISLIVDSDGPFNFDWAQWGEPTVRPK